MVLTYGGLRAMGGKCGKAASRGPLPWRGHGLVRYFLIALAIHYAFFVLFGAGEGAAIPAAAGPLARTPGLQAEIVPRKEPAVADLALTASPGEGRTAARATGKANGAVLPRVQNDMAPELVSEVSTDIDDFRVTGFAILALAIDDHGVPGSVEVVYSDLPAETVALLVTRFTAARFKPAVKAGQVAAASILMRIDVE